MASVAFERLSLRMRRAAGLKSGRGMAMIDLNGSTSARKTDAGLEVRCACVAVFVLPKDGGERRCSCGRTHRYDGKQLTSRVEEAPAGAGDVSADPRRVRPPRGRADPL